MNMKESRKFEPVVHDAWLPLVWSFARFQPRLSIRSTHPGKGKIPVHFDSSITKKKLEINEADRNMPDQEEYTKEMVTRSL